MLKSNKIFKSIKSIKPIAAIATLALIGCTCACGPADSKAADPDVARSYDVSKVQKDEEIAKLVPESVAKTGELTVGVNVSYAPAEFFAADGKTPVGYEIDFSKALAKLMGLKAKIMHAQFDSIIPAIGSKYNVGISGFTVNAERMKSVDFVTYANAGLSFEVRKGNPTKVDPKNLCGKKVTLETGTVGEPIMEEAKKQCKANNNKPLEILSFKDQTDATTALLSGRADVMYADTPVAGYAAIKNSGKLEILESSNDAEPMGAAVKKGDAKMLKLIKAAIDKLMKNGVYKDILKKWGVENVAVKESQVNPEV
ncbi:ABC transporter substrate-binding protein [Gardnerella vaginalis]|uniref:ABC transporter substrate-binding protein n=1 Tax=Gardnerella vaginalis TaxID=2702 RepID=UPI000E21349A|nr:ABC transporter substrate-binding protein [Gardnerella vaginalis]RDW96550.1 ABC transporter substrate-binding protein [Gardnerella vaginalis]RDW98762.1 ABC transporter substrate-binding protein [Gardnerella vaginalis]